VISGCNQKSNRDPAMELTEESAAAALEELKARKLVQCLFPASGRTERWKHILVEAWDVDGKERAVIAELLLRGPQTEGELRQRASRMQDLPTLEDLNQVLEQLAADGFVKRLSPEGQKRGVIWTHLLYPPEEAVRIEAKYAGMIGDDMDADEPLERPTARPTQAAGRTTDPRLADLEAQVADLRGKLADLSEAFDALAAKVDRLTG
jgi:hypothetical protein